MATQKPLIITATGQFQRLPASDTLDLSTLGTGTPDNTTFLRGDGSWAVPSSSATSLALSSLTAATGTNTIASGDHAQVWQWALTSILKSALTITETAASINGGSNQVLVDIATLAASTATPFKVTARGTEAFRVDADGSVDVAGTLTATTYVGALTNNVPVTNLNSGTGATATTFWRGDGTWVSPASMSNTYTKPQKAEILALTHNTAWDGTDKQHLTVNVNGSTFTIANPSAQTAGVYYAVFVTYTTSHTIAFGTSFKGITSVVPTATAGKYDHFVFRSDGTNLHLVGSALNTGA